MKIAVQTAALAVLVGVAIAYFSVPARAAEGCRAWVAEMVEDEGGPVLSAHACSDDNGEAELSMTCFGGSMWVQYDLAGLDGPKQPASSEVAAVEFVTDTGKEIISMTYQEMNGMFGGEAPADGPLVKLLQSNAGVMVRSVVGDYPVRNYSLDGSSKAIGQLVAQCD